MLSFWKSSLLETMNADFIKTETPDDYIDSQTIDKFYENEFLPAETYYNHSNDTHFTDNSLVSRQQYTAECLEHIEDGKGGKVPPVLFQTDFNSGTDQYENFEDSNTNDFNTRYSKNSSILNVPLVKTSIVHHDISLQPSNNTLDVFSGLNRISTKETDLETNQFQMVKESQSTMSERPIQLYERGITDVHYNSTFPGQLHNNLQGTSLRGNSTIKNSVSRRKSTIPRRRERLKESNTCSDEKLVEKEVKKYLLKIPSFAPVMQGLTGDTSPSEGHSFDDSITNQNECLKAPDCLPCTKSNLFALNPNANDKESISCQNRIKEISSHQYSEIQEKQSNTNESDGLFYTPLNNSENYLQNDSTIKTMSADEATFIIDAKPKSSKPKTKVVCELCNKSFGRPSELKRHTLLHTGEKPHSCDECQKVFSQRYHLIRHVKTVHKKEIENLVCGVCSETFNSEYLLMRHVKRHGIMTFACEICSKEYKTKRQMKEHVLSLHVGVKPFKCDQCDKVFARKYHLERHVMIHSGIRDYQCEYCGKEFCTKGNLLAHVRRVHLKVREFSCGVCDKGFYSPKDLQTHLKTHTGEKPYQCEICLKRFSERVNMEWHLRIHSGERPYQCANCEKSYTRMPHLIRHQREGLCARRLRIGTWDARKEQDENSVTEELNDDTELNFSHENSFQEEWNSSQNSISENSVLEMNDSESDTNDEMEYSENDADI